MAAQVRQIGANGFERYARQMILPGWGEEGQARLSQKSVTVIGCGALGSHIANHLARAGVGRLRLADRDFVEYSNLPRQALYSEADAAAGLPKAVAAAQRLRKTRGARRHLHAADRHANPCQISGCQRNDRRRTAHIPPAG